MKETWLEMGYDEGTWKHRKLLLETLEKHLPFDSLLDVGCASGPDMALLHLAHPEITLKGYDLAPENVAQAVERGFDVEQADLYTKLPEIPDKSYDIVLSNGVIMYLEPKVIPELLRIARKAVIMSERGKIHFPEGQGVVQETQITKAIRDSWHKDGFIYEICN